MKTPKRRDGWFHETVEHLLRHDRRKWLKFALRVVGSQEDAEDVLQEAVRRVLGREIKFESEDEVRKYLNRAISNTAFEYYHVRRRERMRSIPLEDNSRVFSDYPDPQSDLEIREDSRQNDRLLDLLREGLGRLPTKQYEALHLTHLDPGASSIRDIGAERGIPYSTLRHRSVQGIRRLRKYIQRALRFRSLRLLVA